MRTPANPKIYHIVHEDRLRSIIKDGGLWCDRKMMQHEDDSATVIGYQHIKKRRLRIPLKCQPGIVVGACVPFYFCPRSVMLYAIYKRNAQLVYQGGEEPIVYLVSDFSSAVAWSERHQRRWAFTDTNAAKGSAQHFDKRADLDKINWQAMGAWKARKDEPEYKTGIQAEFLVEGSFAWNLILCIGVSSEKTLARVVQTLKGATHQPDVYVVPDWYYGNYKYR